MAAEQHAALDVRARHVDLIRDNTWRSGHFVHYKHVVVDAVPGDVHDDRDAELRPRLSILARNFCCAGILETYRVEDPGGRLGDSVLRVARSSRWSCSLIDERAEPRHIDELGVLNALPERP